MLVITTSFKSIFKMRFGICFLLVWLLMPNKMYAQEQVTLSGYVKDASNGETLIGATVLIKENAVGTVTNTYGFYSITIPPDEYTIDFRYIGYETISKTLNLSSNQRLDIELGEISQDLEEIVILGESIDQNVSSVEMSVNKLDMKTINKMPAFLGEVDVIKSSQLLPGVSTVGEGASGFNVRGGSVGQNLVLLDDAPVYNSSHLLGFFSVFNPDAVKDVKLYKGGIPSNYGGRISSILDIQMKEGNNKKLSVQGGIGTIFSRLTVEAPIVKDKGSFIIAGRRSYIDVLAKPFTNVLDGGAALNFYDLTLKANYTLSPKDRLYLSGYFGKDVFKFDANQGFNWGNRTATLRWNRIINDRLFFNLTSFYSDYRYELAFGEDNLDRFDWNSRVRTTSLNPEFSYFINPKNELYFGGEFLYYRFDPANSVGISNGEATDISLASKYAFEMSGYIGNKLSISPNIEVDYGLRYSAFLYTGPGKIYEFGDAVPGERRYPTSITEVDDRSVIADYYNFEPRISLRYQLNASSSLKLSYNRMAQYIHLISNTTASNPLDVWTPSTNNIDPQIGTQYAIGYFKNIKADQYETSLEFYYKDTKNQIEYIDGADLLINEFLEGDLLSGIGRAYGMELSVRKTTGPFTGWISYTLGRSELKVNGINRGEWYPTRFDQTHSLNFSGSFELNDRWTFSSNFVYISGTPTTFPTSRFEMQDYVVPYNVYGSRNNIRIPDYHRLDVSATWYGKKFKKGKPRKNTDYWVFGLYNIYGRRNPFSIYFSQGTDRIPPGEPIPTSGTQVSIIGSIIPAISYNFKF